MISTLNKGQPVTSTFLIVIVVQLLSSSLVTEYVNCTLLYIDVPCLVVFIKSTKNAP